MDGYKGNGELHDLYLCHNIITVIKQGRVSQWCYVVNISVGRIAAKISVERSKKTDSLGY
jgi:hypothetical protein